MKLTPVSKAGKPDLFFSTALFLMSLYVCFSDLIFGYSYKTLVSIVYGFVFIFLYFFIDASFSVPAQALMLALPCLYGLSFHNSFLAALYNSFMIRIYDIYYITPSLFHCGGVRLASCLFFTAIISLIICKLSSWERFAVKIIFVIPFFLALILLDADTADVCIFMVGITFFLSGRSFFKSMQIAASWVLIFAVFFENPVSDGLSRLLSSDDLCEIGGSASAGETCLEVVMEKPEAMYLHGFLGYGFSDDKWNGDPENLTLSASDAYSLKESGYSAQNQLITLLDRTCGYESNTITISMTADDEYVYLPISSLSDSSIFAASLKLKSGAERYTFTTAYNICDYAQDLPEILSSLTNDEYISAAGILSEACSDFTDIPYEIRRILDSELMDYSCDYGDVSQAAAVIYDYLSRFTYDADAGSQTLSGFLQISKCGNACYFATAAVMIFRYYGISARYAEGYAITYDDIQNIAPDGGITLTDNDRHAWAEYYIDGLGWIPFESVFSYIDKLPQFTDFSALPDSGLPDVQSAGESGSAADEIVSGERVYNEISEDDNGIPKSFFLLIFSLSFVIVLSIILSRVMFARKIRRSRVYALQKCAKLSEKKFGAAADVSGTYNFKIISDAETAERLDKLQRDCISEFYSDTPNPLDISDDYYDLYMKCRRAGGSDNEK